MNMDARPLKEFCAEGTAGPRWALWGVYAAVIWLYLLGGAMILLCGAVLVGVLLGQIPASSVLSPPAGWGKQLLVLVLPILMLLGARYGQKGIRALKGLSLKVDASAISVTDRRGDRYVVDVAEIQELRVSKSFWLGLRTRVVLVSGRQYRLHPVRDVDALIEAITTNAGLDSHRRDGRWDVYSRSDAEA